MSFKELENTLSLLQCTLVAQRTISSPEKVTWAQYDVMEMLRLQGDLTPSDLSQKLGISRQNVSKSLRALKKHQFVSHYQSETDKRELVTQLTPEGEEFLSRAATGRTRNAEKVFASLDDDEQRQFRILSRKVIDALTRDQ